MGPRPPTGDREIESFAVPETQNRERDRVRERAGAKEQEKDKPLTMDWSA